MKTLILGISVRAAVESAVRSGYAVVALDAFGDQDTRRLAECWSLRHDSNLGYSPQALYRASSHLEYDAVAYTANLENHPEILESISGGRCVIGNSPSTLQEVRRWPDLFAKLKRGGFSVPDAIYDAKKLGANPAGRWLVKPICSGGGHGIRTYRGNGFPRGQYYLQKFISGKPCSASFVANGKECVIIGITEQLVGMGLLGSRGFRYCGNILPFGGTGAPGLEETVLDQVRRIAAYLTKEYGLRGVNGIDFILNRNRVYVTEVNPRYSASMELIEQAYDLPIFHLHARAALEDELPGFRLETMLRSRRYFGKAILFAERNAVAPDLKRWLDKGLKDVPAAGEPLPQGKPICTILVNRPAFDDVVAGLVRRAEALKKEIYG